MKEFPEELLYPFYLNVCLGIGDLIWTVCDFEDSKFIGSTNLHKAVKMRRTLLVFLKKRSDYWSANKLKTVKVESYRNLRK